MIKIDYQTIAEETVAKFNRDGNKPTLLLHACCGPCASAALLFLVQYFKVTVFYNNANIYPKEEHDLRFKELKRLIETAEEFKGAEINLISGGYDYEKYNAEHLLSAKDEKEGGERCHRCYRARMEEAYDYAEEQGFDYFTTTLTFSRQKDSQVINQIGAVLEKKQAKTKYFYSDFKKHGGQEQGGAMIKKYQLYCQDYCGCSFSFAERMRIKDQKSKD